MRRRGGSSSRKHQIALPEHWPNLTEEKSRLLKKNTSRGGTYKAEENNTQRKKAKGNDIEKWACLLGSRRAGRKKKKCRGLISRRHPLTPGGESWALQTPAREGGGGNVRGGGGGASGAYPWENSLRARRQKKKAVVEAVVRRGLEGGRQDHEKLSKCELRLRQKSQHS